ncbi:MAG TPA: lysophospholipid acyltransferase family protein [Thermoanaerobaculia bacterium]|nr:lysophospholipid acyltransferase family protein [Thermoanaerobaculia bacterium]
MARRSSIRALRRDVVHGGLVIASALGRNLPLPAGRRLGSMLGRLAWHVLLRERRKAIGNLTIAFPDSSDAERRRLAREMFRHLGMSVFEIGWLPNLKNGGLEKTTRFEGIEHLRSAVAQGRGVVLFSGHCGNWEWMAAAIGAAGFDMNVIAREIADERLNEFIVQSRGRFGVETIGRGSASSAREILQTLRRGAVLGLLIDQNLRTESTPIAFFGTPALTPIGPARLAIRSGAVVLVGFAERLDDGTHRIRFQPWIDTKEYSDPLELTERMTRAVEEQIRRVPDQWVWIHARWRERSMKKRTAGAETTDSTSGGRDSSG